MPASPVQVLLVEDHPADIALTRKAFGRLSLSADLHVVFDGREAMSFLRQQGRYNSAPRPDLVLLDLNMPRMGGIEVLREIAKEPSLRTIPVVVLTTSAAPLDVQRAYQSCANSYVVKPVKFSDFLILIETIMVYWFQIAILPGPSGP
jgi:CheY-like chemotaxis protein